MSRSISLSLAVLALQCVPAASQPRSSAPRKPRIEVHGHRGARAARPENTLSAFTEALRVGVDVLELDLAVTADDRLVVIHDLEVSPERCVGEGGKPLEKPVPVRSLLLSEIQKFDCGSQVHPRFKKQVLIPGEKIPSLEEVFSLVADSTASAAASVLFNIETKIVPGQPELAPTPHRYAELLAQAIEAHDLERRVMMQSFDHRTLTAMKKLMPDLPLVALTSDNLPDLGAVAAAAGAGTISPYHLWITEREVKGLQQAGIKVVPWTVNEPREWDRMLAMGVDGIITDDPEALIEYLRAKRLR